MKLTTIKAAVIGFALAFVPLTASAEINTQGLNQDCANGLLFIKGIGQQVAGGTLSHSEAMDRVRTLLKLGGANEGIYPTAGIDTFLVIVSSIISMPAGEQAYMLDGIIPNACALDQ